MTTIFRVEANPSFRDFQGRFARAEKELLDDRRDQARSLARLYVQYAQEEAPKRTGEFARGIKFKTYTGTNALGFTISDPQPLGTFIRQGTKRHIIRARRAESLRFFWPVTGRVMFLKSVNHPGTKPNPYHERAADKWEPEAQKDLARISLRYVKTIAKGKA